MPSIVAEPAISQRLAVTGALLEGHFQLSSGLHSNRYVQCAKLLQHPVEAAWACRSLAESIRETVDVVVGPALGGVVVAYELARALGVRALFTERKDGSMQLRRGFEIAPGERILLCEDVITTGGSAKEAASCLEFLGGQIVAVACLVNRSSGQADFGVPLYSLLDTTIATYDPATCPLCAEGSSAVKPGSRQ
jgi:orotate phosphoribosyltransferase